MRPYLLAKILGVRGQGEKLVRFGIGVMGKAEQLNVPAQCMQNPIAELPIGQRRLLVVRLLGIFQTYTVLTREHYSHARSLGVCWE